VEKAQISKMLAGSSQLEYRARNILAIADINAPRAMSPMLVYSSPQLRRAQVDQIQAFGSSNAVDGDRK